MRGGLWKQGGLLPDAGCAGSVVPWFGRGLGGPDFGPAGAHLAGSVSRAAEARTPRDAATGNRGGHSSTNAARDRRRAEHDGVGKSAAAGVGGSPVGGSLYGGSALRGGAQ